METCWIDEAKLKLCHGRIAAFFSASFVAANASSDSFGNLQASAGDCKDVAGVSALIRRTHPNIHIVRHVAISWQVKRGLS